MTELIVIGGGPIGLEMAQAHRRLGSEVVVLEAMKALGRDDPEIAAIDVNPIIVGRDRAVAVDAVIERVPTSSSGSITLDTTTPAHAVNQGVAP